MKILKGKFKYLLLVFIILITTYFTIFGERGILQLRKLEQETKTIKASAEKIKEENERLKKEIKLLKNDKQYIEKVARKELGLVKKDEIIYKKKVQ